MVRVALERFRNLTSASSPKKQKQALPLCLAQKAWSAIGYSDRRDAEDTALLGGLDDIGAHPLATTPGDLGEAGQNRLQRRRAISTPVPCSQSRACFS
jgi:hypothetical protein